jgi:ribonucleoside-diphosphate reductase alpha subunit
MQSQNMLQDKIFTGINAVSRQDIEEQVANLGPQAAAKNLGFKLEHYEYLVVAGRIVLEEHKKTCPQTIEEYVQVFSERLSSEVADCLLRNASTFNDAIAEEEHNDLDHDWFSANTLLKNYLAKTTFQEAPRETPQQMYLRVAVQMHYQDSLDEILTTFREMSQQRFVPASPTLFNAGFAKPQMSSCFLLTVEDSLDSITDAWKSVASISKCNGGIGMDVSRIRHSEIGKVGMSKGLVPLMRVFNDIIRYADQLGKRRGAQTAILRPDNIDTEAFLDLPLKNGDPESRAHDLNIGLWTPSLFWQRVEEDGDWTMFCPAKAPELQDIWGEEYSEVYQQVEKKDISPRKTVKARDLLKHIVSNQRKTGMPYILHADACNRKSNHRHLGTLRTTNLCLEIMQYTSPDEIAVCNLSSLSLPAFVKDRSEARTLDSVQHNAREKSLFDAYDWDKLASTTRRVVTCLNRVLDNNYYPVEAARRSNRRHRPIGIGVSGFSDTVYLLDCTFESPETRDLNRRIFACMYFNAMLQSVDLALREGVYETFRGSPLSEGKFQFDLWAEEYQQLHPSNNVRRQEDDKPISPSLWGQQPFLLSNGDTVQPSWNDLRRAVTKYGARNSLLLALMPTASTANLLRNCETVEAHQGNIYSRNVLNGNYAVLNRHCMYDLQEIGLWNEKTVDLIQADNGSVSKLSAYLHSLSPEKRQRLFPSFTGDWHRLEYLQRKYKTMMELSQKLFLELAAERGRYICQSQSTNVYFPDPTDKQLIAMHRYGAKLGLKTGMYYLRSLPSTEAFKFTVDPEILDFVESFGKKTSTQAQQAESGCLACD